MQDDRATPDGADQGLPPEEVAALAERHLGFLRDHVRRRTGSLVRSREGLSDIVQSALRELFEGGGRLRFQSEAAFRSWLCTAATHKIVSKHRFYAADRRSSERETANAGNASGISDAGSLSPSRLAEEGEERERLRAAIEELDEEDRQILVLRKLLDVPPSVVATELGLAESTIRWRLARTLAELAARLG